MLLSTTAASRWRTRGRSRGARCCCSARSVCRAGVGRASRRGRCASSRQVGLYGLLRTWCRRARCAGGWSAGRSGSRASSPRRGVLQLLVLLPWGVGRRVELALPVRRPPRQSLWCRFRIAGIDRGHRCLVRADVDPTSSERCIAPPIATKSVSPYRPRYAEAWQHNEPVVLLVQVPVLVTCHRLVPWRRRRLRARWAPRGRDR